MVSFHYCACGYSDFPTPFVEESILSLWSGLGTLVKDHLTIYVRVHFCAILFH